MIGDSLDFASKILKGNEEIAAATEAAINASDVACSRSFWKEMENYFAKDDVDYLNQYVDSVCKAMPMCQNPSFSSQPTFLSNKN